MKLSESFYQRRKVTQIARELLGKVLFTKIDGVITSGMVVETEAYSWTERGCHAYGSRKTNRNSVMFEGAGRCYVYLCYGIHHLFNVVTNNTDVAEAVLVRALQPQDGISHMIRRRGSPANQLHLTSGPGRLTQALGIDRNWNGKSLLDNEIWIEDLRQDICDEEVQTGPRIGIDYAGEDAKLPWRFAIKGNLWLSK